MLGKATHLLIPFLISTSAAVNVTVDLDSSMQMMEGFGGFGPGKTWWSSAPHFSSAYIDALIDDLGFTMVRDEVFCNTECTNDNGDPAQLDVAAMEAQMNNDCSGDGTSDGGSGMYGTDKTDANFGEQVPFWQALKQRADASQEPLRIIGSVWSPPPWMKKCKCIKGDGAAAPDISETTVTLVPGQQTLDELAEFLAGWAKLFNKHVGAYPYAISLQNEALFKEPYASCVYDPPTYVAAIKAVRSRLNAEGLNNIRLYGWEDVTADMSRIIKWAREFEHDTEAKNAISVLAIHNYFHDAITPSSPSANNWRSVGAVANMLLGGKNSWMTESGMGGTSASHGFAGAKGIYLGIKYGRIAAWTWWYTIDNVVDNSGNVYHSGAFYKQFTRFVRPGAIHVGSSSDDDLVGSVAFHHEFNNCFTVVLLNDASSSKTVTVSGTGLPASFEMHQSSSSDRCASKGSYSTGSSLTMPAKSVVTLVSGKYTGTAEGAQVPVAPNAATVAPRVGRLSGASARVYSLNGETIAELGDHAALEAFVERGRLNGSPLQPGCYVVRHGDVSVVKHVR